MGSTLTACRCLDVDASWSMLHPTSSISAPWADNVPLALERQGVVGTGSDGRGSLTAHPYAHLAGPTILD